MQIDVSQDTHSGACTGQIMDMKVNFRAEMTRVSDDVSA